MNILYILILVVIILLIIISDNKIKLLKQIGIISIITSILIVIVGMVVSWVLYLFLNGFNIMRILTLIFNKFIYIAIYLLVIGLILVVISKIITIKS